MLYFLVYSPPKKQQLYYTTHLSIPHPLLEEPAGSGSLWLPAVWWMSLAGPNWDYHRWFRGFNRPEKEKNIGDHPPMVENCWRCFEDRKQTWDGDIKLLTC